MASTGGMSAPAVAIATGGALLMYLGFRNVPLIDGLREIAAGKLPSPRNKAGALAGALAGSLVGGLAGAAGGGSGGTMTGPTGGPWPELAAAAGQFAGDKYSQARRWDPGYSDCSSFVGKSLKAVGVTPPGASITTSYLAWSQLMKVDRSQVGAGDLICNTAHIVIATSNADGIGQENGRLNVQRGSIESLMGGQSFTCLRYTGARPGRAAAAAGMAV